jgi:phosphopantothenoylcysteine decarboxylase/phosphopantothenate--cysteine ligase
VVVTAGPTFEDLDPVRYIGNRSSGRMGFAIAEEATRRGARVTLVAGPTSVDPPAVNELIRVRGAAEMHRVVMDRAAAADVVIMAAAVADFTPERPVEQKITKGGDGLTVVLKPTPDILADLGARRASTGQGPLLVGFAAETEDLVQRATRKLHAKRVDLIVANDVSRTDAGFEVASNAVTLISAQGSEFLPLQPKARVASSILDRIETMLTLSKTAVGRQK